jgi:hypothetical protein
LRGLIGVERRPDWAGIELAPVSPGPEAVDGVILSINGIEFDTLAGLALAIQCHERGWTALANRLLEASLKETFLHHIPYKDIGQEIAPRSKLAFLAWSYRVNELFLEGTDRRMTLSRLKKILEAEARLDTPQNRSLLNSLQASIAPGTAKPGTIEEKLDRLVDLKAFASFDELPQELIELTQFGFDAIPDLLAHLDDPRLTGYREQSSIHCFPQYPWTVGNLCYKILGGLAGWEAAASWRSGAEDPKTAKARATAWSEEARKKEEKTFLIDNALPPGEWPRRPLLRILARKYPEDLVALYRHLLAKRPEMHSWQVAREIASSALSRNRKIDVLAEAAESGNLRHRYAALWDLKELHRKRALKLLVGTLERLPTAATGNGDENSFVLLVERIGDAQAWNALRQAARRADVGLRLDLLHQITHQTDIAEARPQRLGLLADFLEDDQERPARPAGPLRSRIVAEEFSSIRVRDLAAMKLASILDLEELPKPSWGRKEWDDLRATVLKALSR